MELHRASQMDREQQVKNLLIKLRTLLVQIAMIHLHTEVKEGEEFNRLPGKAKKQPKAATRNAGYFY